MSFASRVPTAVIKYFGTEVTSAELHPIIVSEFKGDKGWIPQTYKKRISRSWALKLRKQGVSYVSLKSGLRQADFSIDEIVSRAA